MTQPPLRLGSLCTGYGGLDMAVQRVFGGRLSWVADNDPGAVRILAHHHPHVPNLGDLTAVDWHTVAPVDVVLGGYPCQPFSSAGKRKGTADDRHIWPHIATALGVLRPRYAIFENVAGHLSLGFDTVLTDLARLGFDARWSCVRASDIGAAHQRRRLFLLAWPTEAEAPRPLRRPGYHDSASADAVDVGGDGDRARRPRRDEPAARRLTAADAGRGGLQGSATVDRPAPTQRVADADGPDLQRGPAAHTPGDRREQGRTEPARLERGPDPAVGGSPDWGEYAPAVRRWETVIGRGAPRPTDPVGRLNPNLVEWLMGLPAGHVTQVPGLSRTAQLKALGNGVVPQQADFALRLLTTPGAHAMAA